MNTALKLLTVRGIDIRVHITFPLILIWAAFQFGYMAEAGWVGALFGVIVVTLLFVIVTLHELGHSVAAQYYDVPVKDITLLPIGGVAQLENIPEQPLKEFVIAIAGPAVNFILAALMYAVSVGFGVGIDDPLTVLDNLSTISFGAIFSYVFFYNFFLAVFNLIPAFPLDGGRVLRALLAVRFTYPKATKIAAAVGRGFALLLGLYGFSTGGFFLILIAFFIYIGAGHENNIAQVRDMLRGFTVAQAYSHPVDKLSPEDTLRDAADLILSSFQTSFPVVQDDELLGIVTYQTLVHALQDHEKTTSVRQAMVTDVTAVHPDTELFEAQQALHESDIDALPVIENGRFQGLITRRDVSEVYRLLSADPNLLLQGA